jgi:hypothetical protein
LEFIVDGTPEQCLSAIHAYFVREWPYRGTVYRSQTHVNYLEPLGMVAALFTSAKGVQVFATADGTGRTRLTVTAGRRKYSQTFERWVKGALPKQVAAMEPSTANAAPTAPDIPDQIKKLAELRDAGALTNEEFERKKAELLDRM